MALLHSQTQPVGWDAPDFSLPDVNDRIFHLDDFLDKQAVLVIFTCNHCPYAKASWPLIVDLYDEFNKDVEFVAINPNDKDEYPEDDVAGMREVLSDYNVNFSYLRDEAQNVAKEYKAQCTPDLYLFKTQNGGAKLYYHGRINDNWQNPEEAKEKNLEDAISDLLAAKNPPKQQLPSMGCSIKWKQ